MKNTHKKHAYPTHQDVEDRIINHQSQKTQNTSQPLRITYDFNIAQR